MSRKRKFYDIEISSQELLENYEFCYEYNFSKTKNISLKISENCFYISYKKTKKPSFDKIQKSKLFCDAIRKVYILHLVLFSKPINLDKVRLAIETKTEIFPKNGPLLYSLVNKNLERPVSKLWNNGDFINKFLNTSESNYDSRFSALFAFLVSKSKKYEIERFQNLWIAMNGLYGFYAKNMAKEILDTKISSERQQLELLQFFVDSKAEFISKKEQDSIAKEISDILNSLVLNLNDYEEVITKEKFLSAQYEELRTKIKSQLSEKKLEISEYAWLIIYQAYCIRCNIFHANKPLPLVYFNQQKKWRIIRFVNDLLEDFLDNNLYKFFLDDFTEKEKSKITENKDYLTKNLNK